MILDIGSRFNEMDISKLLGQDKFQLYQWVAFFREKEVRKIKAQKAANNGS